MPKIKEIFAREILNSQGLPTVEAKVLLENGEEGKASVPSGVSRGTYEAIELRDADFNRYDGKGVLKVCENIKKIISPALNGLEITEQEKIDRKMIELDGTKNKSRLGSNALLAVSLACSRAGAKTNKIPLYRYLREIFHFPFSDFSLPTPLFNLINSGLHADNNLEIQEFIIIPKMSDGFNKTLRAASEIFLFLRGILKTKKGISKAVGDEGGLVALFDQNEEGLKFLSEAVEKSSYKLGQEIFLGLDCASSEFYDSSRQVYKFEGQNLSSREMLNIYDQWLTTYPLVFLEDALEENDFNAWQKLTSKFLRKYPHLTLVGDDLFVTNVERFKKGLQMKIANAIVIKPNQIGTVSETMDCIKLAQENHYRLVVSHRSGETNDDFIADLAVAVKSDFIKAGGVIRGERVAKYNRLLEIEEELKTGKS